MNFLYQKLPLYSKLGAAIISFHLFRKKENQNDDVPILKSSFQPNLNSLTVRMDCGIIPLKNTNNFPLLQSFIADCSPSIPSDNSEVKFLLSPLNLGLLANIDDKTGHSWSKQLKIEDASKFLHDVDDFLVKAMEDDCRDIKEIQTKANLYLESSEVCDREESIRQLKGTFELKGKFLCVLGGKSFGKSKCLNSLAKEANEGVTCFPTFDKPGKVKKEKTSSVEREMLVLVVDMRSQGNKSILLGIIEALDEVGDKNIKKRAEKVVKGVFDLWTMLGPLGFIRAYIAGTLVDLYLAMANSLSTEDKIKFCEALIQELAKTRKVTVIIDEANSAFDRALLDEEQLKQAQADLALLTRLTKQERQMNVILSSSEHSFPFKLKKMKFNTDDMDHLLFFNEVSPRDCYDLLVNGWGLGENLAISLLNVYGGHLFNISKAIDALALSNGNFTTPLSARATGDIVLALKSAGGYDEAKKIKENSEIVKALKALAEKGFYPFDDPNVGKDNAPQSHEELISQLNIAGVVERNSLVPGIPKEMWKDTNYDYALIPSSQTMRLMIAKQLSPPPLPSKK